MADNPHRQKHPAFERFNKIMVSTEKNDPIINTVNLSGFEMDDSTTNRFCEAMNRNYFISKIILCKNSLSTHSCMQIFDLLKSNPKIIYLEISDNCVNDSSLEYLSTILISLPSIRDPITLILRKNEFTQYGAKSIARFISLNAPVSWLDLRGNSQITDEGIQLIARSLETNTILSLLDLIKCGCGKDGAAAISDSLTKNRSLKTLLLQDKFEDPAISSLGTLLSNPLCSLEQLYLWKCNLTTPLLEKLCDSLKTNHSLVTLALSYNGFEDETVFALSKMIYSNTSIKKLHLGSNNFSCASAGFLSIAISQNKTLENLDLSRNFLNSNGLWPIAVALESNSHIQYLDIRDNNIDASGAVLISDLFLHNKSITTVRLSRNMFGDAAVALLSGTFRSNSTLRDVELDDVMMTSRGFIALCSALSQNKAIERISVSQNRLCVKAMRAFKDLLAITKTLASVSLSHCNIDDSCCLQIAEGLSLNSSLRSIDISNNIYTVAGLSVIADSIMNNYTLCRIDYFGCNIEGDDFAKSVGGRISDCIERNDYYNHNITMKEMGLLATCEELCSY
ncbi:Leucine Rich Repeat family protein [Trichomonas vaginalis G3]|uniref:Leucine Rich Repeat family protein n=1 Tax=Trichomonas vaginalis (strain ATCC PRA-98 / G3) TaxID=412133 RepID=A2FYN5_TRIV3|nr:uncharacterized protein TVAGG3_0010740 [Trichomonas vaginalis G3]EAX89986.1 Leucine Rich Repeat family protein [Trichomonas vaginalis G3]KAI5539125.1 Ran GTPase-activating protein 1 family [Trichomonas vaginalis G3]|eukprot:XP_001302916.1 hypothetical protein [Trichomonas vaginalis G3]